MPIFDMSNLIGGSFSDGSNDWRTPLSQNDNGERHRAKLLEAIVEDKEQPAMHPDHVKFLCSVNDDAYKELLSHHEILEHIQQHEVGDWGENV